MGARRTRRFGSATSSTGWTRTTSTAASGPAARFAFSTDPDFSVLDLMNTARFVPLSWVDSFVHPYIDVED
jgi:hypothetical protein